ncbi:helix-turn-helix domain-containing protein [bacterium]|nr:helix-turn-helix domain-containing protein [bacterium]
MREKIQSKFGRIVKKERLKAGLSQEKLAEKARMHRTYIGMIERGEKNITIANIEKISKALNISIANLFGQI